MATKNVSNGEAIRTLGLRNPRRLPARVVYSLDGGLVPETVDSPDHASPVHADVTATGKLQSRRTNGLTVKADAMARWMAHGATASDAFRAAYKPHPTMAPHRVAHRANVIMNRPAFTVTLERHSERLEEEGRQTTFMMRDFVKARLVLEAQNARQDSARIQALKLLGQTEGMFTTVHRNERSVNPAELAELKAKLEQRLRATLARLGQSVGPMDGTEQAAIPALETASPDPHPPGNPLCASGSPHEKIYTIPLKQPLGLGGPPLSAGTPSSCIEGEFTEAGGVQSENPAAGYLSELDPV